MAEYIPLVSENGSEQSNHLELEDSDLEKIPEPSLLRRWYRLPRLQPDSSRWQYASNWTSWAREGVPDAKTALTLALGFLVAALPRFLQPGGLKLKKKLHPTAYLDALRGWAALLVFRFHVFPNRTWLFEQSVFRGFLNGRAMVEVFFVISGYVLSYRLLKAIRNQEPGLSRAIASSTFRRWFRLFIPTGFSSLISAVLSHYGWSRQDLHIDSFPAQMLDWLTDFLVSSNPLGDIKGWWYNETFRTKYLDVMWTIPVEYRGSLVVFLFCAVAGFLSCRGRRICCSIIIFQCYFWGTIYAALFLIGLMIADLQFDRQPERLRSPKHLPRQNPPMSQQQGDNLEVTPSSLDQPGTQSNLRIIICILLVIAAFFLFGQPKDGKSYEGPFPFDYLSLAIPTWYPVDLGEYFWLSIGATLLVAALDNCRILQVPFEWSFSQYLGDISFGIYAMHGIVMWVFYGPYVEPFREQHFGDGYWSGLPGILVTTVVVLWCADWFGRFDDLAVGFGRWLESKVFIKWEDTS